MRLRCIALFAVKNATCLLGVHAYSVVALNELHLTGMHNTATASNNTRANFAEQHQQHNPRTTVSRSCVYWATAGISP